MSRKTRSVSRFLSLSVAAVAVLAACATPGGRTPEWIAGVPDRVADGHRIVAYGNGPTPGDAEDRAVEDAVNQVSQILLLRLEESEAALGPEAGPVIEDVSRRRVEVLEPDDQYRRTDRQGHAERYQLYTYRASEIDEDRAWVLERLPAVAPVSETAAPTEDTSPLGQLRAILTGDIPETADGIQRRLEQALSLASAVVVTVQPGEVSIDLGDTPPDSYTVSVARRDDPDAYAGVTMTVRVQGPLVDGSRDTETFPVTTGEDGSTAFPAPVPVFAGTTTVVAEPAWLADATTDWYAAVSTQTARDLLDATVERLRDRGLIRARSRAPEIPTAIVVLDRDIAGNPIESSDTMRGMLQEFSDTDFRIRQVELSTAQREQLVEIPDITVSDLYDVLPFDVLSRVDRVIVGDAQIREFSEEDGFSVLVEIQASAFDLRRDRVLGRVSFEERISGSDARSAIRAAFQAAGRRLVRRIVPQLP